MKHGCITEYTPIKILLNQAIKIPLKPIKMVILMAILNTERELKI